MEEFLINNFEKGFLAARDSKFRNIREGWEKIFKDCSRDEAVLLENLVSHKALLEAGISSDIGGYDGFVFSLVRRIFANLIVRDLVSVQPMLAPTGKVFFLDPQVTTGTSQDYQSMYEAHYDNANYDVSKGAYTILSGTPVNITASNYNSGATFDIPYSGGVDGLASLRIPMAPLNVGDMVLVNATNGIPEIGTASSVEDVAISSIIFNNNFTTDIIVAAQNVPYWVKFEFTATTASPYPVSRYSISFGANGRTANTWSFCGSTDNTSWDLLDYRIGQTPTSGINYYTPTIATSNYKTYMLTGITSSATTGFRITEVEFMGGPNEYLNFAISPTTWTKDIFDGNLINIMASNPSGTSTFPTSCWSEWRDYTGLEASSGMQTMKLNVVSSDVEARSRKIKGKLTEELLQDAEAYFQMNAVNELADLMGDEISAEIDREIIRDLINIAPFRSEWYYDMYALTGMTGFVTGDSSSQIASAVTQYRWAQDSLLTAINKMDATIRKANIYHGANWLICSAKVGAVVETMKEHKAIVGSKIKRVERIHKTGRLKSTIDVYVDPYLPDNICLLGYNGSNWDAGYIYAPYIITTPNTVRDPNTLFEIDTEFMTRYATKIITNKKYGLIDCRFPTDDASKIINEV